MSLAELPQLSVADTAIQAFSVVSGAVQRTVSPMVEESVPQGEFQASTTDWLSGSTAWAHNFSVLPLSAIGLSCPSSVKWGVRFSTQKYRVSAARLPWLSSIV
ncbi:MAG: hypothetical protein KC518_07080 [Candidatus Cloacimonetes bacterium]|nr:hypothetical protein [Candidatus Cloacimonadota bacterium]